VEIKPEWKLDGVNLLPYLSGQKSDAPHEALDWRMGQQMAIRMGDWKLVKSVGCKGIAGVEQRGKASTDGAELYNLAADIGEKTNVAEKEPAKFKELAAAWDKWNSELIDPRWFPIRGGAAANKAGKRNPDRAVLFDRLDKNHDGKLSFEEFMANRPNPEAAKKLFEQWDTGKKGYLTREEFITRGGNAK
jgi:arylsulfatase A-like enzyme